MDDSSDDPSGEKRLLDRLAIETVLARYAHGVDRIDIPAIKSAFWPGAIDEHGTFNGPAEDFADYLNQSLRRFVTTMHSLANVHIEFAGDIARVESYVTALHVLAGENGPVSFTLYARYLDKFERRGKEWRIAHRLLVRDWADIPPEAAIAGPILEKITRRGRPAPEDSWHTELPKL